MKRALVIRHVVHEGLAGYRAPIEQAGYEIERVAACQTDFATLDLVSPDLLVVMGGPMGAYDEADHPWLVDEKRVLREAVEADVPVWGVCLGAQVLASALGARVYRGERPEVGLLPVHLTEEAATDPVFRDVPSSFPTLQWHGDSFDLPAGATLLASSPAYPHQAFRVGRSYGLQFHIEVSLELASEWAGVPAYAESLEATLGPGALDRLLADVADHQDVTVSLARKLFGRWVENVVALAV